MWALGIDRGENRLNSKARIFEFVLFTKCLHNDLKY